MITVFKTSGILLFVLASTAFGFFKAHGFEARVRLLKEIYTCMENLKEHIRYSGGELARLLEISFGRCPAIKLNADKVYISSDILEKEDIAFLEEFFSKLGHSLGDSEYSRISLYQEMLKAKIERYEGECAQKSKIWRTFGICIGFAGAVMLI